MTWEQGLFLVLAVGVLASAVMVVTARRLIHAVFWLISVLMGVAILYAMLRAGFLVVVQVVVYVGAIAILFIFAIMLTRRDLRDHAMQSRRDWWLAALISLMVTAGLLAVILALPQVQRTPPSWPSDLDALRALGKALISPEGYVLPFEVASVLLLAALLGAVYLASTKEGNPS